MDSGRIGGCSYQSGTTSGKLRGRRAVLKPFSTGLLVSGRLTFFLAVSILAVGCRLFVSHTAPVVEFITVPAAAAGNPSKLVIISGRVVGAQAHQLIVLYARDRDSWYVQPFGIQPFTKIQPDSTWKSLTHPGTDYAALLVGPGFHPPLTTDVLPTEGVMASAVTEGTPPFWTRGWFVSACVLVCVFSIFSLHRFRLHQMAERLNVRFEERLAERMRVAQILHDTLLQGVISTSMQLHIATDQLAADSPALVPLRHVLNSMGQVIEEGRTTLRGLRSKESVHDLARALSEIPQELELQEDVGFRVTVKGRPLPLQPSVRVALYSIGRDVLLNAFRESRAREVKVELRYKTNQFRLRVRHDGRGSGSDLRHSLPRGSSLLDLRQQAESIGARLKVRNRLLGGTEIDLRVPAKFAFESHSSHRGFRWLDRLHRRREEPAEPDRKTGTG